MSNDFWLFCSWGCWKFCFSACWLLCDWGCWRVCGCGHWRFCGWGFCVVWGWRIWGHILGPSGRFPSQSSSLCSSSFLQMGQCGPHEHFSVACLDIVMAWGIAAILVCSVLMVGAGVRTGVGGTGQSFLVSNRFSDAEPALDWGVPCLTGALGISSGGGGLSFMDLVVGWGTSANCPMASLCIVTSMDSAVDLTIGSCVLTVTTMGLGAVEVGVEGVGWVSTFTLYLLLAITVFLLFVIYFRCWGFPDSWVGAWLDQSLMVLLHMDLLQLGWLQLGLRLGFGLGTKSPFQFQICSHFLDKGGVRMESCAPGITFNYLGCLVPSKYVNALHCFTFTSMSTVSVGRWHLK